VSIFLKDKVQNSNGKFVISLDGPVPWESEVPGTIRLVLYVNGGTGGQAIRPFTAVTLVQIPD